MKRTEFERMERDLKKSRKKQIESESAGGCETPGDFINKLFSMFFFDENKIYNVVDDTNIYELLEEMKEIIPEKQWENVLRKAIKKTKVKEKEDAFNLLNELMS